MYECSLKDDAAVEGEITDRMRQRRQRILHKLCIDMERSEYTSFSMLAMLKCRDEVERVGTALQCPVFLRPLSDPDSYSYFCSGICSTNMNLSPMLFE